MGTGTTPSPHERIPVDALEFGTSSIRRLLGRFGEGTASAVARLSD